MKASNLFKNSTISNRNCFVCLLYNISVSIMFQQKCLRTEACMVLFYFFPSCLFYSAVFPLNRLVITTSFKSVRHQNNLEFYCFDIWSDPPIVEDHRGFSVALSRWPRSETCLSVLTVDLQQSRYPHTPGTGVLVNRQALLSHRVPVVGLRALTILRAW